MRSSIPAAGTPAPKGVYRQNDFGIFGGGPVRIPKIYNGRDKTFFHVAYEGFRNRVGSTGAQSTVPTPEMWDGDFSNWVDQNNQLLPIFDPFTTREASPGSAARIRTAFPGNKIPASMFSTFAKQMMPYGKLAVPNRGGVPGTSAYVRNNFITTGGTTVNPTDKGSLRFDHSINDKQRARDVLQHDGEPAGGRVRADLPDCRCRCIPVSSPPSIPRPIGDPHLVAYRRAF